MRNMVLVALAAVCAPSMAAQGRSVVLLEAQPTTVLSIATPGSSCESDRVLGMADAQTMHSSGGRFGGGMLLGITLGLIGTGIAYALASSSEPIPMIVPEERNGQAVDANCYRVGYVDKAKSKNKSAALSGGLLGTAAFVLIVVASTSN